MTKRNHDEAIARHTEKECGSRRNEHLHRANHRPGSRRFLRNPNPSPSNASGPTQEKSSPGILSMEVDGNQVHFDKVRDLLKAPLKQCAHDHQIDKVPRG